jgi:hypothetical protein
MSPLYPGLLVGLAAWLADIPGRADEPKAGTRRALIVCGLPGDDEHRTLYAEAVEKLHKALTGRYGFEPGEVLVRFGAEKQDGDGPALAGSRGLSDRAGIEADVADVRRRLGPDDTLWVIVLGHGHLDGRRAHLNLPGPDLDDRAFGKLFDGLKCREQVFLITTSASGFFLKPLSAPGRIVITATEADQEVNETVFPLALADALASPPEGIDRDKDGSISVFELYLAVVTDVLNRYLTDEDLPTEHAQLDDNGDGRGSEVQQSYLPPELGGPSEKEKEKSKGKEKKIGPKDDGALASKVRVDRPAVPRP